MSRDTVNSKDEAKQDIIWETLIARSELEISACREKIKILSKSLKFFKKQADSGIKFPAIGDGRLSK